MEKSCPECFRYFSGDECPYCAKKEKTAGKKIFKDNRYNITDKLKRIITVVISVVIYFIIGIVFSFLFAGLFFLYFFLSKQVVYWKTLSRFGYLSETPEYFILNPLSYIYFTYFLWIANLVYLCFLPYKIISIPVFICISFAIGIMGRIKACKKRDEIERGLFETYPELKKHKREAWKIE